MSSKFAAYGARRERRSNNEAKQRAKAQAGGEPDKIEAWDGRLEPSVERWTSLNAADTSAEVGVDEGKSVDVYHITCARNHVITSKQLLAPIACAQLQCQASITRPRVDDLNVGQHGHPAHDAVA